MTVTDAQNYIGFIKKEAHLRYLIPVTKNKNRLEDAGLLNVDFANKAMESSGDSFSNIREWCFISTPDYIRAKMYSKMYTKNLSYKPNNNDYSEMKTFLTSKQWFVGCFTEDGIK